MEPDAIEVAMRQLQPDPHGWRCELPARFLDRAVGLRINTRSVPADGPPPPPDAAELGLARRILEGLPGIIAECERHYRQRYATHPELVSGAHEPHVWLCRELPGRETPEDWTFVVGVTVDPGWGTHAEFRGLEYLGMWSGD